MSLLNGTVTAGPSVGPAAAAQLMPVMIGPVAGPVVNGGGGGGKDSRWLTLEVCREFARSKCSRSDEECKYAHPPPHVEIQNGRVMCCFDSIKGKCQRKEPPCKYLHPPQHLKEILLQNGRQNLINKNMQLQAALQPLLSMPSGMVPVDGCYDGRYAGPWTTRDPYKLATDNMDFMVYEPGPSGAIKHQTATIIPNAGAYSNGIVLPGPSSATSNGGQYLFSTMLQQPNAPQFILPAGATNAAAGYPCYGSTLAGFSPTAFYPTIDGSSSSVSLHPGSLITHNGAPNRAWTLAGLQAASGSYGLPVATSGATIHTMPYDVGAATQFQQVSTQTLPGNGALPSSSSAAGQLGVETPSATGLIPPTDGVNSPGLTSTSLDQSITSSSMSYCQPSIYYKRQVVEVLNNGMSRKRLLEQNVGQSGVGEDFILGMTALPNGSMVPVFKRHALIDAKTGLPVYQQLPATAPSYQQQMTALNSFQPQQFVSVSIANPSQLQRF